MASRILVVHYSRTGNTRQLAERIARALGADLEAIADPTRRGGVLGFLRSAYEALRDRRPAIGPPVHDPAAYSMVVIGTPVWSRSASTPVLSYLERHREALGAVAFFCSCGSTGGEHAFERMARVVGRSPASTLTVRESELAGAAASIDRFVAAVRAAAAGAGDSPAPRPTRDGGPKFA
ncbi:MAG TPA: flavodoxin [Kofleriaceae bacterium]|nr:flavodoxin [Kofleriaceae bacterium]